jgi:hypothetical protein
MKPYLFNIYFYRYKFIFQIKILFKKIDIHYSINLNKMGSFFSKEYNITPLECIDVVNTYQSITRYGVFNGFGENQSGFYKFYQEENGKTFYLVSIDIFMELVKQSRKEEFDTLKIKETNEISYFYNVRTLPTFLVGFYYIEGIKHSETFCMKTFEDLPKEMEFCPKN